MAITDNQIVVVNVSQQIAATPNTLQKTGIIVTQAGTTGAANTVTLITDQASLTAILNAPGAPVTALQAAFTTFTANNQAGRAVYVLELGTGTAAQGVTALAAFIALHPKAYYAYLCPNGWGAETTFHAMLANYTATNQEIYFFFHIVSGNVTTYNTLKCVFAMIPAAAAPSTEFSVAGAFAHWIGYAPSATNLVTPMAFAYMFGVTAYGPTPTEATTFKTNFVNFIDTGAEGGISNTILKWGVTGDGRDATYWYSVDWYQINLELDITNAIINGSNNPLAPLYYNQNGINRLKAVAQNTTNRAITYGMILSPATVSAIDFLVYTAASPSDYPAGIYNGLSISVVPARGFVRITFAVSATDFITA